MESFNSSSMPDPLPKSLSPRARDSKTSFDSLRPEGEGLGMRVVLQCLLQLAILTVFFMTPWWVRPVGLPKTPYIFGFLITIPGLIAFAAWVLLGFPGLTAASRDSRRWWIYCACLLLGWAFFSVTWAGHKIDALNSAYQ